MYFVLLLQKIEEEKFRAVDYQPMLGTPVSVLVIHPRCTQSEK